MIRSDPGKYAVLKKAAWFILGTAAIFLFFKFLLGWIMPFLVALAAAKLLEPLIKAAAKKIKLRRQILSALFVLAVYGLFGSLLYWGLSILLSEIAAFLQKIPDFLADIPQILEIFRERLTTYTAFLPPQAMSFVLTLWDQLFTNVFVTEEQLSAVLDAVTKFAVSIPNIFAFFATMIVATFLISADYGTVTKFIMLQIPTAWHDRFYRTKTHLVNTLWKWIKALLILLLITFTELCIGLSVLGIDHAVMIAALIALVDLLPILGTGCVLIPWAIFELFIGNQYRAIFLAVLYGIISLVRNLLEPRIIGAQLGLHPLATLACVYIGYRILGLWGMLLFPILAITVLKFQEWGYIRVFKMPSDRDQRPPSAGGNGSVS